VEHVDGHVHLKKKSVETEQGWKTDTASCSSCGAIAVTGAISFSCNPVVVRLDIMSEPAQLPLVKSGGWLLLRMLLIAVIAAVVIFLIRSMSPG